MNGFDNLLAAAEQMFSDFRTFKERVNALWEKPTDDLTRLLYEERNPLILQKYNLRFA